MITTIKVVPITAGLTSQNNNPNLIDPSCSTTNNQAISRSNSKNKPKSETRNKHKRNKNIKSNSRCLSEPQKAKSCNNFNKSKTSIRSKQCEIVDSIATNTFHISKTHYHANSSGGLEYIPIETKANWYISKYPESWVSITNHQANGMNITYSPNTTITARKTHMEITNENKIHIIEFTQDPKDYIQISDSCITCERKYLISGSSEKCNITGNITITRHRTRTTYGLNGTKIIMYLDRNSDNSGGADYISINTSTHWYISKSPEHWVKITNTLPHGLNINYAPNDSNKTRKTYMEISSSNKIYHINFIQNP